MNLPSKTTLALGFVTGGLLLAGVITWLHENHLRHHSMENGLFEKKYRSSIDTLRLAQDAVDNCFRKYSNHTFVEIKIPVQESIKTANAPLPTLITLQGISTGQGKPVAMINEKVYQKGDRIGDLILQEIRVRSVLLSNPGGTNIEIKLMEATP